MNAQARFASSYADSLLQLKERRTSGQQHWEADTTFLVAGNVFYFTTLIALHKFMKHKDAYNPKLLMQFYNVSCVILAAM